jgi:hypothetical protein
MVGRVHVPMGERPYFGHGFKAEDRFEPLPVSMNYQILPDGQRLHGVAGHREAGFG